MIEKDSNTSQDYEPQEYAVIKDLDTLRAISDPLRLKLLETILDEPLTVKQIARELNLTPTKLYYHINQLEEHNYIRVVNTRVVSGIIEKQYRATAQSYRVDPALLSLLEDSDHSRELENFLAPVFDSTKEDIKRSIRAGLINLPQEEIRPVNRRLVLMRGVSRLPEDRAEEFYAKLKKLIEDFSEAEVKGSENQTYGLMIAAFPIAKPVNRAQTEPEE
ncbi:MAG TPA: helix-turn-helix domain-containing protein [Chloroflexia bacterium]|nr:helix-turn-helix domain-containing protein [Chloroflexia bacterium]